MLLKVLLLTIHLVVKQKSSLTKKIAATSDGFRNIPCHQGDTRGVRHLFCIFKACGVRGIDVMGERVSVWKAQ